ncbi:alpha/beta-hydrolase [Annulohypoxylon truncatum]|uniref:alpha/beta-hydrolase n=1 Tax=Annulohypoxylon truncatum TaxID=327061 RepID=UPI002008E934|nr:alpha/beta-hydrolase [Annulohypoxylon truncatum]KAI1212604.1 alpha/beta-hydrolase [Annulohypoxylon truncatum]
MASKITSSGYVLRDSVNLFYEREGKSGSRTVLFIHGLGGTTNSYQPLVSDLLDFDLVRFDFAGHGRSSVPSSSSVESYVADCEDVISHLGLKDVVVVGHSFGGLISLHLAAKHPEIVKGVVTFGAVRPFPEAIQKALTTRSSIVRRQGMVAVADAVVSSAFSAKSLANRKAEVSFAREMLTRQDPEGYALAVDALAQSSAPVWSQINGKVIILSGDEDKVSTLEVGADIVNDIGPNAQQVTCKDTGHWHMLESPDECIKAIISVASDESSWHGYASSKLGGTR